MRLCTVPGCERRHKARGLCGAHYKRAAAGKPVAGQVRPWVPIIDTRSGGNPELTAVLQGRSIADLAAFCDWILLELGGATVPPAHAEAWFNTRP